MRLLKCLRSVDMMAILLLLGTPLVFFWQVALGERIFYGNDISSLFFPMQLELARALQEGRLPLWTIYLQSGFPLFAEGHVAALDPFNLILYRFLPAYLAMSYTILLRLAWLSIGTYLYCRSAGLGKASAFFAGFCILFSGFTLAHLQHLTLLAVASWLPWLLLFQDQMQRTRQAGRRVWALWFLAATLAIGIQFLSGFPQVVLINLIPYGLISIFSLLFRNRPAKLSARAIIESLGITVLSVVLGLGVAAAQLVPAAELLNLSVRALEMGEGFFTSYSMPPIVLTQFIFPFLQLGEPSTVNQEYWGYLGILPLALAPFAVLRRDVRVWLFLAVGVGAAILALGEFTPVYPLLYNVPVFDRFRVPARFLLLLTFAAFVLAANGFEELQRRARDSNALARRSQLIALSFALFAFGLIVTRGSMPWEFWSRLWTWLPLLLVLLAIAVFLLAFRSPPRSVLVTLVLGLSIIDLLLYAQPFLPTLDRTAPPSEPWQVSRPVAAMDSTQPMYRTLTTIYNESLRPNHMLVYEKQSVQIYSPLGLARSEDYLFLMSPAMLNLMNVRYYTRVSYPRPEDEAVWGYAFLLDVFEKPLQIPTTRATQIEIVSYADNVADLPDGYAAGEITLDSTDGKPIRLPIRIGIETADWAYEGLQSTASVKHSKPANVETFPAFLPSMRDAFNGLVYVTRHTLASPLDVTSVSARSNLPGGRLVVERVSLIDEAGRAVSLAELARKNEMKLAFKSHAVAMFENLSALPRAFIVHQAEIVPDDQILARMRQPDFRPEKVVLLSEGQPLREPVAANRLADQVTLTEYTPERVVVKAQAAQPGYLILADSFYPGWEASVDGARVTIQRANYIYRAVQLPPGEHTIVFEFRPASFYWGAGISGLSLFLCAALGILGWKRR